MTITAKVIAHSIGPVNKPITTVQLRYPKFIHGELMTHRVFSRNASSSRAIPVKRLIQDIIDDPAMPLSWGKNQPGMQAGEEIDARVQSWDFGGILGQSWTPKEAWLFARDNAIKMAQAFDNAGYHKQIVNRIIEPFCHINVVVTSTEWNNFYALRRHKDAQPEIHELADKIHEAIKNAPYKILSVGEWHLPYITSEDILHPRDFPNHDIADKKVMNKLFCQVSTARCARVSYLTHEMKKPRIDVDLILYDQLVGAQPVHASPAEHQATPDTFLKMKADSGWENPLLHGNFDGWIQYRKTLTNENMEHTYDAR